MQFWKRHDHHEELREDYARRPIRERREQPLWWAHLAGFGLAAALALGLVWSLSGWMMLEKTLKALASPLGLVWLALFTGAWFSLVRRQAGTALLLIVLFVLVTAAGNLWVMRSLASRLEQPWREQLGQTAANDTPFDVLVVLGGGTSASPEFKPQLTGSGDRVMQAARIWHAGQARLIVVTGEQAWRTEAADPDPAEEARDLLIATGVPAESITALRGFNTSDEIAAIRQWLGQQPAGTTPLRVGLVTSAWHMTRATTLARSAGLDVTAVPADWITQPWVPDPSLVIPSSANLDRTSKLLHELLGNWIGR